MSGAAFRRVDLPVADRAQDLLEQLTPAERIAMLHQAMPAIERLGIPPFHTGPSPLAANCVSAGIFSSGITIRMPIASATIVPIFRNVDR